MSPLLGILLGLVLLLVGADFFVRGSVAVARRLRLPPHLIGLTLVAWGASLPELVTGLSAAMHGAPGLALGNAVGSNIANALLVFGITAIVRPFAATRGSFDRDTLALGASAVALVAACQLPFIDRTTGIAFVALLIVYLAYSFVRERAAPDAAMRLRHEAGTTAAFTRGGLPVIGLAILGGLVSMLGGGDLLGKSAKAATDAWGVADSVIGLTLVAFSTSLPEAAAAAIAAYRRQHDVAIASLIGSSVFNALGVVGAATFITAIPVPGDLGDGGGNAASRPRRASRMAD
jgi:cation:H+ antiporter